jgi:hypothetical protein
VSTARSSWSPGFTERIRALVADRQALVTAVLAPGRPHRGRQRPTGDPILRRYERSTGVLSWFEVDDEHVWLIEKTGASAEAWCTRRRLAVSNSTEVRILSDLIRRCC